MLRTMSSEKRYPAGPRHRNLAWLKGSLVAGAVYDLIFAAAMVLIPELSARLLGLRLPQEPFYLWLIAVFLLMMASFYLLAAYDPKSYSGNIDVGIAGRFLGFLVLMTAAILDPSMPILYALAAGDLFFAVAHAVFWLPIRR